MRPTPLALFAAALLAALLLGPDTSTAHCDGLDGPVVGAARKALETGDASYVLIWVHEQDEAEVRRAFDQARALRKTGPEAAELADRYFFETVVRVHRAGEGAPYTGLKPAGRDLGPAIPAADKALEDGNVDAVVKLVTAKVEAGIRERFREARARKEFKHEDVKAGREYVEAYVAFIHFVERLYADAEHASEGHFQDEGEAPAHEGR